MMRSGAVEEELLDKLRQLEESLWIGESRFDDALMDDIFAEDFYEVGRSGKVYSRDEMLVGEEYAGKEIDADLPLHNFSARYLSHDVVQVTYTSIVRYGDETERGLRSSIWSYADGKWWLRFHQGTPCGID